jgi:hypothetical protein
LGQRVASNERHPRSNLKRRKKKRGQKEMRANRMEQDEI